LRNSGISAQCSQHCDPDILADTFQYCLDFYGRVITTPEKFGRPGAPSPPPRMYLDDHRNQSRPIQGPRSHGRASGAAYVASLRVRLRQMSCGYPSYREPCHHARPRRAHPAVGGPLPYLRSALRRAEEGTVVV
jgi:hypothetical protein